MVEVEVVEVEVVVVMEVVDVVVVEVEVGWRWWHRWWPWCWPRCGAARLPRDAEVAELDDVPSRQEDVGRLQVAVLVRLRV